MDTGVDGHTGVSAHTGATANGPGRGSEAAYGDERNLE